MNWNELPQETRDVAQRVCTEKELDAWKLSLSGAGYRRIGFALNIATETARGRLDRARRKINDAMNEQEIA